MFETRQTIDESSIQTLTETRSEENIEGGLKKTEILRIAIQHGNIGMGTDLVESPMFPPVHWESKDIIIRPENPIPHTIVAVMPGFGHTADTKRLGHAFEALATHLSSKLNVVSFISVEKQFEPEGSIYFQIPGYGKARSLLVGLNQFPDDLKPGTIKDLAIIGFSNSCYDALVAARRCQKHLAIDVRGIVFVAPTDNPYSLVDVMSEAGRPVIVDRKQGRISVGSRGTFTSSVFYDFRSDNSPEGFIKGADWGIAEMVKELGPEVVLKVFYGLGDPVVNIERSSSFAQKVGTTLTRVNPNQAEGTAIHNFDDDHMRERLSNAIQEILNIPNGM